MTKERSKKGGGGRSPEEISLSLSPPRFSDLFCLKFDKILKKNEFKIFDIIKRWRFSGLKLVAIAIPAGQFITVCSWKCFCKDTCA